MSPKKLILSPFQRALKSLEDVLLHPKDDDIVRDATIQRFEYTYELAHKMIARHLTWSGESDVKSLTKRALFRRAAEVDLIDDPEKWFAYNDARNSTSHTYNEQNAREVYEAAKEFAIDARRLLTTLEGVHD